MGTPIEKELLRMEKERLKELEVDQKAKLRKEQLERQQRLDKERAALILMSLKAEIINRMAD